MDKGRGTYTPIDLFAGISTKEEPKPAELPKQEATPQLNQSSGSVPGLFASLNVSGSQGNSSLNISKTE